MKINVSRIKDFQRCKRLHFYRHTLGYSTRGQSDPLLMGNWGHYLLALVLQGVGYDEAIHRTKQRQIELGLPENFEEVWEKFTCLMLAHKEWQATDVGRYADKNLEVISVEEELKVERFGYTFTGQVDALVRHKYTRDYYVFERKITRRPEEMFKGIHWDYQPRFYCWLAQKVLGVEVRGVIYELIRNCNPCKVKILKNGLPSKARSELDGTTYEVYRELIPREELDNYKDQLLYLDHKLNKIFSRKILVPRNLDDTFGQVVKIAGDIVGNNNEFAPPALNRYSCKSPITPCPFSDVCLAQDDKQDYRSMLDENFYKDLPHFDEGLKYGTHNKSI